MILRALAPPTFPSLLDPYAYETVQLGGAYLKLWTLSSLQIPMSFPIQLAPFLSVSTTPHTANRMIFLNQTTWVAFLPKFSNGSKIHYMNFIHPNLISLDGSSPCLQPAPAPLICMILRSPEHSKGLPHIHALFLLVQSCLEWSTHPRALTGKCLLVFKSAQISPPLQNLSYIL